MAGECFPHALASSSDIRAPEYFTPLLQISHNDSLPPFKQEMLVPPTLRNPSIPAGKTWAHVDKTSCQDVNSVRHAPRSGYGGARGAQILASTPTSWTPFVYTHFHSMVFCGEILEQPASVPVQTDTLQTLSGVGPNNSTVTSATAPGKSNESGAGFSARPKPGITSRTPSCLATRWWRRVDQTRRASPSAFLAF
ncbi:hypothetical protein CALVIDRAFT_263321 [Calocera viscosa TUFC12733]|uniref:Uncharacterized protein n=1 Tax=Calocera viscosa (strain TUFC12733) TaxID=1330018 RepID=A0A167J490_CALVF|nr:hypothetical protein CALVIDRAFT_263321 [Calocera viscosa TUFC12733]